jgi:hypothetical protein
MHGSIVFKDDPASINYLDPETSQGRAIFPTFAQNGVVRSATVITTTNGLVGGERSIDYDDEWCSVPSLIVLSGGSTFAVPTDWSLVTLFVEFWIRVNPTQVEVEVGKYNSQGPALQLSSFVVTLTSLDLNVFSNTTSLPSPVLTVTGGGIIPDQSTLQTTVAFSVSTVASGDQLVINVPAITFGTFSGFKATLDFVSMAHQQ